MPGRYRAEQVGSLLRPTELLQARTVHAEGKLALEELRAKEDQAILQALEKQRQRGLDVYTDGEMPRGSWLTDMADAVEAFVAARVDRNWNGPGGGLEGSSAKVVGGKRKKTAENDWSRDSLFEAARYVPIEDLAVSPQCGFASVAAGKPAFDGRSVAQSGTSCSYGPAGLG